MQPLKTLHHPYRFSSHCEEKQRKQQVSLSLRRLPRSGLLTVGVTILLVSLLVSSLAACAGQTSQSGTTPSPTATLQPFGPDSGLYMAHYAGSATVAADAAVYRVDYRTGKVLWKYQFKLEHPASGQGPYAIPSVLLVKQGYVFVESQSGVVYAITAATGHLAWSYTFARNVELVRAQRSTPVLEQGTLYVPGLEYLPQTTPSPYRGDGPSRDLLYAFDASTGKLIQTYQSVGAFTVANKVLYASDNDKTLRAISLPGGTLLWQAHLADQFFMTPHVVDGKVYVIANNQLPASRYVNALYAFDAITGQQLWRSQTMTAGPVYDLAISGQTILCGEVGGSLYAFDAASGQLRWSKDLHFVGSRHFFGGQNPLVEGNNVYATFNPNSVDATSTDPPVPGIMILDVATGSIKWQKIITTPRADDPYSDSITALLAHNGMLYITRSKYVYNGQTMTGTVYQTTAMHPGGKTLWQINLGGYNDCEALVP